MCTLSIIPHVVAGSRTGVRIECNRDESRLRPTALPPQLRQYGERRALLPIDPVADGTWIAASDAPLVMVLMNVYIAQATDIVEEILPARPSPISRGTIIPHALSAGSLAEAIARVEQLDVRRFEPFRLILIDPREYTEILWAAEQFSVDRPEPIEKPLFFTSSGLGDDIVAGPRRELFEETVVPSADPATAQDDFHRSQWPGREFASVWMTRREARTVSITRIEMTERQVRLDYLARGDDADRGQFGDPQVLTAGSPG